MSVEVVYDNKKQTNYKYNSYSAAPVISVFPHFLHISVVGPLVALVLHLPQAM